MTYMFKLKVMRSEKEYVQAENKDHLKVTVVIFEAEDKDETPVETRYLGFPISITSEDLKTELKKFIDNYNTEREMAVKNAESDRIQKQADEVINDIAGLTL